MAAQHIAYASRAFKEGPYCGDQMGFWHVGRIATLCIADGLGHGQGAQSAAAAAVGFVAAHLTAPLPTLFAECDAALLSTRGVSLGVAVVDEQGKTLTYAGVGNTRAVIVSGQSPTPGRKGVLHLGNDYGIIGAGYKQLTLQMRRLAGNDLVVLYTDGLPESADLKGYGERLKGDLQWLADKVLQDWGRPSDDAAVLIFRMPE